MRRTTRITMSGWTLTTVAVAALALAHCGGSDNGDSEARCQIVCDKSEACGGAPDNCMEQCLSAPPSDACLECYQRDSCADVGACYYSNCKDDPGDDQPGNVSDKDCATLCEKRQACEDELTLDACKQECKTKTMVEDCLACPDIEDCVDFWYCIGSYNCWNM